MGVRPEGYGGEDRMPWLETVEEDYGEGTSPWRILLLLLIVAGVVAAALLAGYWLRRQPSLGGGTGQLIAAPEGDYKIRPDKPGGLVVEGEGDTAFSTSEGATINGTLAFDQAPEDPVVAPTAAPTPTPAPRPVQSSALAGTPKAAAGVPERKVAAPPAPKPATPVPASGSAVVQLGSFPSEGAANAAWDRLSRRFKYLAPLGKSVVKAEVDDKTVYRLRVTAGTDAMATDLCGRLRLAGERCFVAN